MNQHTHRFVITVLSASVMMLSACGGGNNSASPQANTGNIPNLATRPSAQASQLKTVRLAGSVFNAVTGTPVDKVEVFLEIQDTASSTPVGTSSSSATPRPNSTSSPNSASSSPRPTSTPTIINPTNTTPPTPIPTGSLAAPNLNPSPAATASPGGLPTNENVPSLPAGTPPPTSAPAGEASLRLNSPLMAAVAQAFMLAQNTRPSAKPSNGPNAFKTTTNNRGKFFINDVPEGKYILTVTAPGYRSLTLTEISPNNLDIPLTPQSTERMIDVVGTVLSPAFAEPVADATVSSSFLLGEAIGIPGTSDGAGQFLLPAVPFGKRTLVAFTQDENQNITKIGTLTDVVISPKMKTQSKALPDAGPTLTPSPTADPGQREKKLKAVEDILNDASPSPSVEPSADPSVEPDIDPSIEPLPETSPMLEPPASPSVTPTPPELDPANNSVENEEESEEDGFNLLDAATELLTGEKPEQTPDEEVYPVIKLNSVISDMVLAGDVTVPEGYRLKSMDIYMILPAAKNEHPEEVYLYSRGFRQPKEKEKNKGLATQDTSSNAKSSAKSSASASNKPTGQPFRLILPEPIKLEKYHLQFTAVNEDGQLSYHHVYNLDAADEEIKVDFMPASTLIELEGEDVNAIPPAPGMGWEPVPGADIYHVTLIGGSGAKRRVVWEAWTKKSQIKYPLTRKPHRLKEQEVYTVSIEAIKGLRPAFNGKKKQTAHPSYQMIWKDLSRITHTPFEVVE